MRYFGLLLIACLVLTTVVVAADDILPIEQEPTVNETTPQEEPISSEVTVEPMKIPHIEIPATAVKYNVKEKTLIETIIEFVGLEPVETTTETTETAVDVEVNGDIVAKIPADSKFVGLEIHDFCLLFQYGTDRWYRCEMSI